VCVVWLTRTKTRRDRDRDRARSRVGGFTGEWGRKIVVVRVLVLVLGTFRVLCLGVKRASWAFSRFAPWRKACVWCLRPCVFAPCACVRVLASGVWRLAFCVRRPCVLRVFACVLRLASSRLCVLASLHPRLVLGAFRLCSQDADAASDEDGDEDEDGPAPSHRPLYPCPGGCMRPTTWSVCARGVRGAWSVERVACSV
jgi:hypothetical protein